MNLIDVMERFPDQAACIAFLEHVRWKGNPKCPHCESQKLTRREHETETGRIGRWNCQECKATFRVLHGTLFHGEPKNTAPKVVSCYILNCECEEKHIELSTPARFIAESKDRMVYAGAYPC